MNPSSRLGPRLNTILEFITRVQQDKPYPCIWDCCCDHGYLGIKILSENLCEKLVFVDQLPHLIEQLSNRLTPFCTDNDKIGNYELITADAGDLCFDAQQRHLVILAGVGGETSVEIVTGIEQNHPDVQVDYIFCPSASHNALREYLAINDFGLMFETLTCEKQRYYEIMYVKGKSAKDELPRVTLTCTLWEEDNEDHQRYLAKINAPRASKKPKRKRCKI
ncbi:MAG: hypothetical protein DIZ80_00125 [endosymbiont of Galathealinum brachiosum]|uniref:SAM-dependent methyltransferase n=1 Tax=endosymbiont of Galathealinum brachiosum TaxID=2200906 RepID=A0A370DM08_9GAMM|nr:MAG: hypothetical protein DIZ80_00125 [endosymbiont of Galathealinum brachiosum]